LQHDQLVTQNEDLDLFGPVGTSLQHQLAHERYEEPIDQHQRHRWIILGRVRGRAGRSMGLRSVSGTHTVNERSMLSSSRAKIHEPLVPACPRAPPTSAAPGDRETRAVRCLPGTPPTTTPRDRIGRCDRSRRAQHRRFPEALHRRIRRRPILGGLINEYKTAA
jgi:hypothetical protein